ncbi:MAG: hypothetical protein DMG34_15290 [Acidobacteria bacterium]|nr:MAG: hypothetical protein DMG34_15290 [Acidobacteriota bacterium]
MICEHSSLAILKMRLSRSYPIFRFGRALDCREPSQVDTLTDIQHKNLTGLQAGATLVRVLRSVETSSLPDSQKYFHSSATHFSLRTLNW